MTLTFVTHTPETAPEASRPALTGARRKFGYVPSPLALHAESPALLEGFAAMAALFDRTSLAPLEREVVIMSVARENDCDYCVAMHSRVLTAKRADAALIEALRGGAPLPDARLEALRGFTVGVLAGRGAVDEAAREAFFGAGFTRQQALDVVVGVGAYTLSTYANRLTRAPLDAPLEEYRWSRHAG